MLFNSDIFFSSRSTFISKIFLLKIILLTVLLYSWSSKLKPFFCFSKSSIIFFGECDLNCFKNSLKTGLFNVNNFALNVGLFSKFIVILYNERIRIGNSKELRGILYKDMNIWNKIKSFFDTIFLGYRNCINKISKIKIVMKVRNFNSFSTRSNYRLNKFGKIDTILVGINVVILILVIVY